MIVYYYDKTKRNHFQVYFKNETNKRGAKLTKPIAKKKSNQIMLSILAINIRKATGNPMIAPTLPFLLYSLELSHKFFASILLGKALTPREIPTQPKK